ncbi:MAG: hypothetical protein ACI83H_000514 [Glaciecola sp.]|jgi:hypothetical protein
MLPIKLNNKPTKIQQTICYHRQSPIFKSHKSYKNWLAAILTCTEKRLHNFKHYV